MSMAFVLVTTKLTSSSIRSISTESLRDKGLTSICWCVKSSLLSQFRRWSSTVIPKTYYLTIIYIGMLILINIYSLKSQQIASYISNRSINWRYHLILFHIHFIYVLRIIPSLSNSISTCGVAIIISA